MKIIRALFAMLLVGVFLPTPADAENLITLSKPSFQLADGRYLNNDLATSLRAGGELDSLLSSRVRGARTWLIDPALDRKSTRLNSSHVSESRMPSSA